MGSKRFHFSRSLAACLLAVLLLPASVRAGIEVEVTGVGEAERDNVLVFLSFQRYRDSNDLTEDTLKRLNQRVEREVKQALKPFGYYFPKVTSELTPGAKNRKGNGNWRVRVQIEPGQPVVVEKVSVKIDGPGAERRRMREIVDNSPLREGQRLIHGNYDALKGELQRMALSIGYLDASFSRSELKVDLDRLTAEAVLEFNTGERYRFGPTVIEQDSINPSLARRFLRYEEGANFSANALLRTQFALEDSQYFSTVEVLTGQRDHETLTVPVNITADAYRRNTYSIGAGYATDTGARGTLGWDNRRVNRSGHRLHTRLTAARAEQSLETRYLIPVGDPALEKLAFDATALRQELADLEIEKFELRPGLTHVRDRWQRVLFLSATRERTQAAGTQTRDILFIPGISYARVPRNYSGDLLTLRPSFFAELSGSHGFFGSDADYLRLRMQGERAFNLSEKWHLLLRGELGTSFVADFSELPGSQRFFAGGDNSVRGFSLNELSPEEQAFDRAGNPILDENGNPTFIKTGGRHLLVGSVEVVRDLPRNFGVAVFVDAGNSLNKLGDRLEYAAGIGIRWRLPVVTVGIDVAQALSIGGRRPHLHLNISPKL